MITVIVQLGTLWRRSLLTIMLIASACGEKTHEGQNLAQKHPSRFWTKSGHESCGRMDGKTYCFYKDYIIAKNFDGDAATGYLLSVPIGDTKLLECNKRHYILDQSYPSIRLRITEPNRGDSLDALFARAREQVIGPTNHDLEFPRIEFNQYGMKCLRYKMNSMTKQEMICSGGAIARPNTAYLFGCARDGAFPNSDCIDTLYRDGLEYRIVYNKACKSQVHNIRNLMLNFVEAGRLLGEI